MPVFHVLSTIRPESLRTRLKLDLDFLYHHLGKGFRGFIQHSIKLPEAFQLVENGKHKRLNLHQHRRQSAGGNHEPPQNLPKGESKTHMGHMKSEYFGTTPKTVKPVWNTRRRCLFNQLQKRRQRHEHQKLLVLETKLQNQLNLTIWRLTNAKSLAALTALIKEKYSSFTGTFCESDETMSASGRADDDSDESIVSAKVAEWPMWDGIGKMSKIARVPLQMALKRRDKAQKATFLWTWMPPHTVLRLAAADPLAVVNALFLFADANLAVEDLLNELPVLKYLSVDTKTLLKEHWDLSEDAERSLLSAATTSLRGGKVSRLMIARLNCVANDVVEPVTQIDDDRPCFNFYRLGKRSILSRTLHFWTM